MLWINVDVAKYVAGQNTSCATCRLKREDMEFVAITWFAGGRLRLTTDMFAVAQSPKWFVAVTTQLIQPSAH